MAEQSRRNVAREILRISEYYNYKSYIIIDYVRDYWAFKILIKTYGIDNTDRFSVRMSSSLEIKVLQPREINKFKKMITHSRS